MNDLYNSLIARIINLIIILGIISILSLPLAIWKVVELIKG